MCAVAETDERTSHAESRCLYGVLLKLSPNDPVMDLFTRVSEDMDSFAAEPGRTDIDR